MDVEPHASASPGIAHLSEAVVPGRLREPGRSRRGCIPNGMWAGKSVRISCRVALALVAGGRYNLPAKQAVRQARRWRCGGARRRLPVTNGTLQVFVPSYIKMDDEHE
jgi:hypothetical protein